MGSLAAETVGTMPKAPGMGVVIPVLGVTQILAWGSSYYLLAVLARPIAGSTDWPLPWVVGGLSLGLVTAGLVSPRVGDTIERHGGRPVLGASAALLALGLVGLALAPSLLIYLAAWLVLGVGMGAGLYDAAFATLGRLYRQRAPRAIATLTLFGGFASTVCWPLSALLVSEFGWRGACLIYAGIHLAVVLPLYVLALPREPRRHAPTSAPRDGQMAKVRARGPVPAGSMLLFMLLATTITVSSMISTVVSVHLLSILRAREIALAAAVALGAVVGPSQVGARAIEMLISRYHHPIWTMVASTIFVASGVGALWAGLPIISAALVFYGAGIGIESIARGTLPLALFGEDRYPAIMGRIAMPSLIAQAVSPSLGALLMERSGASGTLAALFATAILNVVLVFALFALLPRRTLPAAAMKRSQTLRPTASDR
jgi:MFS family permease